MFQKFDFGPVVQKDGTLFRFWAPLQNSVILKLESGEIYPMSSSGDGWFQCHAIHAGAGSLYCFELADGLQVPDPASRFQPDDVHGPSEVVDLDAYDWKVEGWRGRPWEEIVIYEIHIGAYTQEGGYLAVIDKLDHLKNLGVTAIQLMPVSDFPGRFGWGYDGVLPYAPESSYGRPEHLQALVDEAHGRGICVFLDVVYNHFGPDGNYLPNFAPLFNDQHTTPWGAAVNYDGDGAEYIREFIIQNAIYWITAFKLDGLRLDAVHAIKDDSKEHLLHELARRVRKAAEGRAVHLIVENEDNSSGLLRRTAEGEADLFNAQWNDDIHHVLHVAATGETFGYYKDYTGNPANLGKAFAEGFVFQGEHMPYRGEARGEPTDRLPPSAFISFIQNHDQIGNRAKGDRMTAYRPMTPLKAIAAAYLLAPQIPMLFMGEEWGAKEPFPFFCEFSEELNQKVREGRRKELSRLPGFDSDDLLDPVAYETFLSAKLDWSKLETEQAKEFLAFYRSVLAIRHEKIVPLLKGASRQNSRYTAREQACSVSWLLADDAKLQLFANLSDVAVAFDDLTLEGEEIFRFGGHVDGELQPWSVIYSIHS